LNQLAENRKNAKRTLELAFEELHAELERRKNILLAGIEESFHVQEHGLQTQKEKLENMIEAIHSSIKFTDKLLEAGNDAEVLLSKESVVERLNNLDQRNIEIKSVYNGVLEFDDEHKREELSAVISQIGLIGSQVTLSSSSGSSISLKSTGSRPEITSIGKLQFLIGEKGTTDGQFERPAGVCINQRGEIFVSDGSNDRIQIFDKEGRFLMKFGPSGSNTGNLMDLGPWHSIKKSFYM